MAVNLQKGQKIQPDEGEAAVYCAVMVGLGWDRPWRGGFLGLMKPEAIDCDASVILCGADGKIINRDLNQSVVYFGNLRDASDAIIHQGDNRTGEGEGDDEQIIVDLSRVPANVQKMVFTVNIYDANKRGQHFGMIRNAFIRLVDISARTEICRYNLSDDYGMTGLIVGEIYRSAGEWKFNAVGQPVKEASRLQSLVNLYT